MSQDSQIIKNFKSLLSFRLLRQVLNILLIPFIIKNYDSTLINIWLFTAKLYIINTILEAGFRNLIVRGYSVMNAGGSIREIVGLNKVVAQQKARPEKYLKALFRLSSKVGLTIAAIGPCFSILVLYIVFFRDGWLAHGYEALINCIIVIFSQAFQALSVKYTAHLDGNQKYARSNAINSLGTAISLVGSFVAVCFSLDFVVLSVCFYAPTLLTFILHRQASRRIWKNSSIDISKRLEMVLVRSFLPNLMRTLTACISATGFSRFSGSIAASFLSPTLFSSYLIGERIFRIVGDFSLTYTQSSLPLMHAMYVKKNFSTIRKIRMKTSMVIVAMFVFCVFICYQPGRYCVDFLKQEAVYPSFLLWCCLGFGLLFEYLSVSLQLISHTSGRIISHLSLIHI